MVGPWEALVTFQQMIVLADKDGGVDMTADAISRETTIPLTIIAKGIEALEKPDPESRSPDEEGRRIVRLSESRSWGWRIVNYPHYRRLKSEEDRREYHRQYWHKRKAKERDSTETQQNSTNSIQALSIKHEALSKEEMVAKRPFDLFWEAYPKKVKKKEAVMVWQSKRLDAMAETLAADVSRRLSEDRRWLGGFVCDPPTYLRGERWNDAIELVEKSGNGADAAAKEKSQTLDLAEIFGIAQGTDDWQTFKAKVDRANARRLESLGH